MEYDVPYTANTLMEKLGLRSKETFRKHYLKPAMFIAKNKKIGPLLKELQQNKMHIAVILDEFGGTVGIVTMEDILEELVGEIWDEHDEVVQEIKKVSDTEYLVAGRIPARGDCFSYENLDVTVVEMDEKRVELVRIARSAMGNKQTKEG